VCVGEETSKSESEREKKKECERRKSSKRNKEIVTARGKQQN